ncbi:methyltransferase family protein [Fodinicurvata sediminis]|uniref:methyltransferase family protein n=1 Tax=Fodinicurvata sediminis TaxID=1121832 RepID=UPI0003B46161|nr:isoprenylcysteine carboxylmethyltransferase family protein [Fodinicurvata sediminis]
MSRSTNSSQHRDTAGVIAPPPLIFAVALGLGFGFESLVLPLATGLPPLPRYLAGALLAVIACLVIAMGLLRFRRAGTPVEPWHSSTAIVTDGIYGYTRNPMYLGMTGLYLAIALLFDSLWNLILLVPLLAVMHYGVIRREERYLEGKFGDAYLAYRSRVRRWL